MATPRPKRAVQIGPFSKGMNNFSDPSALPDDAAAELLNMELDLDGSLVSRPPFHNIGVDMPLRPTGDMQILGYYYTTTGAEYLIASDGSSSTYYLSGGTWNLITNTFSATAMTQFDDKAWLLAPVGSANPGGTWTPGGSFVAEPNMPRGTIIVAFKFRLWVAQGEQALSNGSRLFFSKVLGVTPFWPASSEFVDIARGDGQNIISVKLYYESLLVFRTGSIYRFQYTSDPAAGTIEVSVPGVGLDTRHSIDDYENYFYFSYDDKAYEYLNGRANEISQAITFEAGSRLGFSSDRSVSVFRNRAIFAFYDTLYVFNLVTRTWSRWRMPSIGGIGTILEQRGDTALPPAAYAVSSKTASFSSMENFARFGSFESLVGVVPKGVTASTGTNASTTTDWKYDGTRSLRLTGMTISTATYADLELDGLVEGQEYTIIARQNVTTLADSRSQLAATLEMLDVEGPVSIDPGLPTAGERTVRTRFYASGNTARVRLHLGVSAGGGIVDWDSVTLVQGNVTNIEPFSGASAPAGGATFSWVGTPGESNSIRVGTERSASLYRITESLDSDSEPFNCIVRTKVFSYDAAAGYKRLFWWGVDAIFRMRATGVVIPISYGERITWGDLLSRTWGDLLMGTWGQPTSKGLSVETTRPELGARAIRKFVKFKKGLRFRQVQFELRFDTTGSSETAPVRLFSIHTEVAGAQTVSKAIS